VITECTVYGNEARYSGGVFSSGSSLGLAHCAFEGNHAYEIGGGMYCYVSSPTLLECTFSENTGGSGGGIYCRSSSPTLAGCTFSWNDAREDGGGGMYCYYASSPVLTGCTFSGNQSSGDGGGLWCSYDSTPALANCIIAFSTQGEAIRCSDQAGGPEPTCSDLYGNAGGDWVGCIAGQFSANGNFSADPLFCMSASPVEGGSWGAIRSMFR
jgi:predicted outer membrane repeat protein